jgi:hypothetical protein
LSKKWFLARLDNAFKVKNAKNRLFDHIFVPKPVGLPEGYIVGMDYGCLESPLQDVHVEFTLKHAPKFLEKTHFRTAKRYPRNRKTNFLALLAPPRKEKLAMGPKFANF